MLTLDKVKMNDDRYNGLFTKCQVKLAGYWKSSFFACVSTETGLKSVNYTCKIE